MDTLVPTLKTKRLILRPIRLTDFDVFADILMSDRAKYMDGPYDREAAWSAFTQCAGGWILRGAGYFAIQSRCSEDVLGFVGMGMEFGDQEHELGYFLCADAEGQGIATEAIAAVRDFALGAHELPSLVSYIDPAHSASSAVASRIGAARDQSAEARFDDPVLVWRHKLEGQA